jgi:hypothetical protein
MNMLVCLVADGINITLPVKVDCDGGTQQREWVDSFSIGF